MGTGFNYISSVLDNFSSDLNQFTLDTLEPHIRNFLGVVWTSRTTRKRRQNSGCWLVHLSRARFLLGEFTDRGSPSEHQRNTTCFFCRGPYQPFGSMILSSHFQVMYQKLGRQTTLIVYHLSAGSFAVDHAPSFCKFSACSKQVLRIPRPRPCRRRR
jgi:hypothetical protein